MVVSTFDALAQAAFSTSESIFAINSPSTQPSRAIDNLVDRFTISNSSPVVATVNANADPFQKIQLAAATNKELTSVIATSDVLLPAIPHLFKIASQRSAVVVHVETREREHAVDSAQKNHKTAPTVPSAADLMAVRQTGFAVLTSDSTQEAFDLALVAQAAAVQTSTPFLNAVNSSAAGSTASKAILDIQKVAPALLTEQDLAAHRERQAAVSEISLSSLYLNPKSDAETKEDSVATAASAEEIYNRVEELLRTLQKHTGRSYRAIEYEGPAQPKTVAISLALGVSGLEKTIKAHHKDVGLIKVRLYRPWSERHFLAALPASVERVIVYEQAPAAHTAWIPLFLDVSASFHAQGAEWKGKIPTISSARFRGSGAELSNEDLKAALVSDKPVIAVNPGYVAHSTTTAAPLQDSDVDTPYIQMLSQVFADRLNIENGIKTNSVWGSQEHTPEFGYGALVTKIGSRARFAELISKTVQDSSLKISEPLRKALTQWHLNRADSKLAKRHGDESITLLKENAEGLVGALANIYSQSSFFAKPSHWLIGADSWAHDIANSGVHHIIASEIDINVLILDTEPYSSRAQNPDYRKKDIGLYAMNYGSVYVASVAVYSSYSHVLHALIEADQYQGPSVVLAYLPRPEDEGTVSPITILKETKLAVDTGYWPLYRWNPALDEKGEERFRLDSERIKADLQHFLDRENHLSLILQQNPDLARTLTQSVESETQSRDAALKRKAKEDFAKLMGGLGGPPLLILFTSDGSNGEGLAKRLVKGAKLRNLNARYAALDDVSIEDLTLEKHVIFVVSTAGQGEFPVNGRDFWKALDAATELGVSETKFAVFGLGDSHYWPREEDAIFYNRPSKDVFAKMVELGGQPLLDLGLGDDQDADSYETAWATWEPKLWESLGCKPLEGVVEEPKKSADDAAKVDSNFLRGTIAEGLLDTSTGALTEADTKLTKFHGIYQQDDRDLREERKKQGLEKAFSFMVRVRVPGGVATPAQWLAMDKISDITANGTLKLTTRQAFQFHGVLKRNLKQNIQLINKSLLDTLAACGDVNRNIMCNPNPHLSHLHKEVNDFANRLSAHLLPRTSAYREIWLDDKLVKGEAVVDHEPLYGPTYLPRKFKIVVAVPPSNDVDVFAHDLGYIAIMDKNGKLEGFNVTVGGGMGMTHGNKKTYPRTADIIAYVTVDQAIETGEKVMLVQRDFGDRMNRKHARMKYTIDDRGIEWFKTELQSRLPFKLEDPRPFKFTDNADRYGWTQGQDKLWHYCCYIENGRVKDTPAEPHKTGLREIAKIHHGDFRLTPNQHLVISNINESEKAKIQALLEKYKLDKLNYTGAMLNSMACVAFPTCGLAMAESERYLPSLVQKFESTLEECGLRDDAITIRMTGCPNGCARPYVAEIAFVGKAFGAYNVYLGGGHHGERLNKLYKESLTEPEIIAELKPMIKRYATERHEGEHFGDFVIRAGIVKATLSGKTFHDLS